MGPSHTSVSNEFNCISHRSCAMLLFIATPLDRYPTLVLRLRGTGWCLNPNDSREALWLLLFEALDRGS